MARSGIACGNRRTRGTLNKELTMSIATVDRTALETKVKRMYSDVAANPHGEFHFEMGRAMAERLGYAPADLDRVPAGRDRLIRRCRTFLPPRESSAGRPGR